MTTREDIRSWLHRAKDAGADYMLVVCDTYSFDDYPVPFKAEEAEAKIKYYNSAEMQRIMECYDLSLDLEKQLDEFRASNYPPRVER